MSVLLDYIIKTFVSDASPKILLSDIYVFAVGTKEVGVPLPLLLGTVLIIIVF